MTKENLIFNDPIEVASKNQRMPGRDPEKAVAGQKIPEALTIGAFTICTLPPRGCRWPLALVDGERTFCGDRWAPGDPRYCAAHVVSARPDPDWAAKQREYDRKTIKHLIRRGGL